MRRWGMQLPHLALLLTLLLAAPARATDLALDAAQAHTTTGQTFFTNGKFPEARIEFEAAYGLSKEPDLLFNIALAWEREGLVREAIGAYERYLSARPSDVDTKAKVERMRLATSPPPTRLTEVQKPKSRLSSRAVAGLSLLSVGAASLVACVVTGSLTAADRQSLGSGTLTYGQAQSTASRASTTRALSIAFGSLGAAGVVVGLPLLVWR